MQMMDVRRRCSKSVILIMQEAARQANQAALVKMTRKGHTEENTY